MSDPSNAIPPDDGVAGVDEVGRGCLAGPVYAAAVILPRGCAIAGLADSKTLSPARRAEMATIIRRRGIVAVGIASVEEIEAINILQATLLAMTRALSGLVTGPSLALVDGDRLPANLPMPARAVIGGDASVAAISAASIVAKVARDSHMRELGLAHRHYGWDRNAGYGTGEHRAAIARHGICAHHRRTFRGVREYVTT